MKGVKNIIKLGWVFGLVALLSACGGAPSDAQVRKALEEKIQSDLQKISDMPSLEGSGFEEMANSMMPQVENLSPQGCEAADNDVYNCTVEATITVMGMEQTTTEVFRFKKQSGKWEVVG
ncbi:MAG: hypothetical protein GX324_06975 [Aeromonadales bacterium]|nr:hypothetical protein [Aeromonadales bacterium]